jgi:hypothetical protein
VRWIWIVLVAAGCGFEVKPSGTAGDDTPPGIDASVDASGDAIAIDAPIDGPPPNPDLDGDGILNTADNCPTVANTTQYNEDNDAFGDACDLCPQYAAVQMDSDSDGIGNDCDPRPQTGGDTLVLFEGFHVSGTLPAGWTTSGSGSWVVIGGKLSYSPAANNPGFALWTLPSGGDHTVDTQTIVGSVQGTTPQVSAVVIDATPSLDKFFMCSISSYETLFRFARWNQAWSELSSVSATPAPPNTYTVIARSSANSESCRVGATMMGGGTQTNGGTRVGFRVVNVNVQYAYVAVYRSG